MAKDPWNKGSRWPTAYHHAIEMQRVLFEAVRLQDTKPMEKAALAKAYATLEEMKRIIAMRPAPKAVDVSSKAITVGVATFIEDQQKKDTPNQLIENGSGQ